MSVIAEALTLPKGYGPNTRHPRYICKICSTGEQHPYEYLEDFAQHIAKAETGKHLLFYMDKTKHWWRGMVFSITIFLVVTGFYCFVTFFRLDYLEAIILSTFAVALGFVYSAIRYNLRKKDLKKCADQVVKSAVTGQKPSESDLRFLTKRVKSLGLMPISSKANDKTHVFSTIFGVLAGLALTYGVSTYYDDYIATLEPSTDILFNRPSEYIIPPTLYLIDFFVVAIPIVHSGYIFLSHVSFKSIRTDLSVLDEISNRSPPLIRNTIDSIKTRLPTRAPSEFVPSILVTIFIVSIVQAAFLFFLGGSIANSCQADNSNNTAYCRAGVEERPLLQSNAFVFWLMIAVIMATAGSILVKRIIKENRVTIEWILLYAFTVGFVITVFLTIFQPSAEALNEVEDIDERVRAVVLSSGILLSVLSARSILDYYIGQGIYFPEIFENE